MAFQICDMVTVARFLNLTLVVPELDKTSFWSDPRYFPFLEKATFFLLISALKLCAYRIFLQ